MWRQGPIWEPKGSNFRPYSITILIFFYIGNSSDDCSGNGKKGIGRRECKP